MLQLKYCRKNDIVFSNNLFGGGKTLVEQSNERIGRDPVALKSISKKTGVNVIMGCGYYKDEWMPCDVKDKTIEDIVCNASISVQRMAVEAAVQGDDLLLRQVMMMDSVNYINNWEKVHSLEIRAADYIKEENTDRTVMVYGGRTYKPDITGEDLKIITELTHNSGIVYLYPDFDT